MELADEKLVENYLNGDEQALGFLVDKYLKPLYNFVFQLVGEKDVSDDIVQETFFKAWKNIKNFEQDRKFSTWLFAIAKNSAFDWLRKKRELNFSSFADEDGVNFLENLEDEDILYSHELLRRIDEADEVREVLDDLNPELKTILLLHHVHGFALSEIAQIMGKSRNTLKSRYRRTLMDLRQKLFSKKAYLKPKEAELFD